ncbi:hypothetical protein AAA799N04_01362 [Marine Group I thaumarchaeote SCGC AAA799-N04]|uniref:Uncharacterized protein n=6 Tax=Marine Group I TaxID=905826 RepID=A0A081RLX3_9ARCH|nr:hypothetical protein AAA799N04_01362 [Marine Group I thaumarchaeote SCGC AAA799-N04]KFM15121.1 hypothetical protein AAA799D11_01442 [Marine Group I thaumarchaeote SCGC AAA799-D11]
MNDLLDDVKALLEKDFGDDRILKQIRRACENNEVISNFERNYVRKLAEKHLGRKPDTPAPVEKPVVPDVVLPETESAQNTPYAQKTQTIKTEPPRVSSASSKNSKLMIGIGGVALVVIIAIAASFSGITNVTPDVVKNPTDTVTESLVIQTDFTSYNNKDIISINGVSDTGGSVNLSIENQKGELVWAEQLSLKSDGRYSTLAIAGGPGWESSGTYTIKVDNGAETKSSTFSFTA